MSKLFSCFKIKDLELKNRIVMAPMCMKSADDDGFARDWHYIHYSSRAIGGVGLIILEATGVLPEGRITDQDLGIWSDTQIESLKKVVDECHKFGAKVGIQLGHAGRKSECLSNQIFAPSAIAFDNSYRKPTEMSKKDIERTINAFKAAAKRALSAGFDIIELHGAHGYLINQFLSPLTNKRNDEYGGSVENRVRFLSEVLETVKTIWPNTKPIILRVSAEEYSDGGNTANKTAELINLLKHKGIDIVDVSSGGTVPAQLKTFPGYQTKCSEVIKHNCYIPTISGGLVTSPLMAEEILCNDRADLIFLGRELLRNPYWTLQAAKELKENIKWPVQYERSKLL